MYSNRKCKHSNEYRALENKSITKKNRMQNKWMEYKIFGNISS